MSADNQPDLPPPVREPKRRLSLYEAMNHMNSASSKDGYSGSRPRANTPALEPTDEFPLRSGQQQEMEAHLLELQAEMVRREDALNEKERKLMTWERELNEQDALLEARRKVIESSVTQSGGIVNGPKVSEELQALQKLKAELDAQESALKESRQALRERERYVEECENELVEKSMQLTEREAHIEQLEEDQNYNKNQCKTGTEDA